MTILKEYPIPGTGIVKVQSSGENRGRYFGIVSVVSETTNLHIAAPRTLDIFNVAAWARLAKECARTDGHRVQDWEDKFFSSPHCPGS
jgi:hypothetical protein